MTNTIKKFFTIVITGDSPSIGHYRGLSRQGEAEIAQAAKTLEDYSKKTVVIAGPTTADVASAKLLCDTLGLQFIDCSCEIKISHDGSKLAQLMQDYQNDHINTIVAVDAHMANQCIQHIQKKILKMTNITVSVGLNKGDVLIIPCHNVRGTCRKGDLFIPD